MRRSRTLMLIALLLLCGARPAPAQDVRGLEICTAEKQMERRTGCLQANVEFLQQVIERNARETRQRLDAAAKEIAAARVEIGALKAALATAQERLQRLEKPDKAEKDAKPK